MGKAKTVNPIESAASELARLIDTRSNLQARDLAMAVEVGQAVATRRKLLIENADSASIAQADRTCREIEGTAHGIADALAEVERRIAAIENRIEVARAEAEREKVASDLERNAGEIQTAANDLANAIDAVAKAHAMLAITISGPAAGQFEQVNGVASPSDIATFLVLKGIVQAMPGLEIHAEVNPWSMFGMRQLVEGADPIETVSSFAQRIRQMAEQVRTQEVGQSLPARHDASLSEPVNGEVYQLRQAEPARVAA